MKNDEILQQLETLDFVQLGKIEEHDGRLKFDLPKTGWDSSAEGWVYVWRIVKKGGESEIAYVGKAGNTLKVRCDQHATGFNYPIKDPEKLHTGAKLAKKIREEWEQGHRIVLHARYSPRKTILGANDISLCEVEEMALIKLMTPAWNKIHKSRGQQE